MAVGHLKGVSTFSVGLAGLGLGGTDSVTVRFGTAPLCAGGAGGMDVKLPGGIVRCAGGSGGML